MYVRSDNEWIRLGGIYLKDSVMNEIHDKAQGNNAYKAILVKKELKEAYQ